MSIQPSSIVRCTTMGEVWHHISISTKRYWHLVSSASINLYVSSQLKLSQLHWSMPVLSLSPLSSTLSSLYNFLTKFLSNVKLIVVLYMWRISSMYWFFSLFFLGRCALVESCLGDMKRGDSIIKVFKTWVYYTIYVY